MTNPRANELIDQAFFAWSDSYATSKLDLVASSLKGKATASLSASLKEHIRLQGADRPAHALSYIDLGDGTVAVLRRVLTGHSNGRNNSHALIGSAKSSPSRWPSPWRAGRNGRNTPRRTSGWRN